MSADLVEENGPKTGRKGMTNRQEIDRTDRLNMQDGYRYTVRKEMKCIAGKPSYSSTRISS